VYARSPKLIVSIASRILADYSFDPLNLGTDETFVPFREAEIKHGRLAMLAAVAWPLQEIFHPIFVDLLRGSGVDGVRDVLAETNGFSPSLLNGGLLQPDVAISLSLAVFMASVLELKDLKAREAQGLQWNEFDNTKLPGDLRFDPLRLTRSLPNDEKVEFLEKELLNGRIASTPAPQSNRRDVPVALHAPTPLACTSEGFRLAL
jgi:hypothetical protein